MDARLKEIKRIYDETRQNADIRACDRPLEAELGVGRAGFEILLGPPVFSAKVAFVGFQPGALRPTTTTETARELECSWPAGEFEFAHDTYPFAARVRALFGKGVLGECVGLNAIFVRARNVQEYNSALPLMLRKRVKEYCSIKAEEILSILDPRAVLVIGLGTLSSCGKRLENIELDSNGNTLIGRGEIFGRKCFAIPHLTGSRIRTVDFERMKSVLPEMLEIY